MLPNAIGWQPHRLKIIQSLICSAPQTITNRQWEIASYFLPSTSRHFLSAFAGVTIYHISSNVLEKTGMLHLIMSLYLHQCFRSCSHFGYVNLITLFLSELPQQRDYKLHSRGQIQRNQICCFCISDTDVKGCERTISLMSEAKQNSTFQRSC